MGITSKEVYSASNILCKLLLLIIMFYYEYLAKQEQFPLKVVVIIKLPDGEGQVEVTLNYRKDIQKCISKRSMYGIAPNKYLE